MQEVFRRVALAAQAIACVLVFRRERLGQGTDRQGGSYVIAIAPTSRLSRESRGHQSVLAESELFGTFAGIHGRGYGENRIVGAATGERCSWMKCPISRLPVQVKLLRVLEHGEVTPVGSGQSVPRSFGWFGNASIAPKVGSRRGLPS